MINAVLDTNILVSGLLTADGNPSKVINFLKDKRFTAVYNDEIIAEYRDVLFRDKLGLNAKDVEDLLGEITKIGFPNVPAKSGIPLPDEDDRVFYDTAKSIDAYLVTGNLKHFPKDPHIITAVDFVKLF